MVNLFSIVLLGFVLGMRHATDPDHVIAVTTIVSRERRASSAALIGIVWGIGHTITILVVGGAIILFDLVIPPRLGLSMEFAVAIMLIVLGVVSLTAGLRQVWSSPQHSHPHQHGEIEHSHPHHHDQWLHSHERDEHAAAWGERTLSRFGTFQIVRPLVVGVVHGLAGSAALALLVLATIPNPVWAFAYLLVFGVGTIAGMMVITTANAVPFILTVGRATRINRYLGVATGLLSLGFGLFMIYQIGIVDGLFSGQPTWTPG